MSLVSVGAACFRISKATVILAIAAFSVGIASAQCPAIGADTGCGVVITVTNTGAFVSNTGQGPYDQTDDTLVGVVNLSSTPLTSLVLTSSVGLDIFGFDGDGLCGIDEDTDLPFVGAPAGCPYGPTGYEGPGTSFINISGDASTGTVIFNPPIPPFGTAYFSLEESLTDATSCSDIINNSLLTSVQGANVCATFTPSDGSSLSDAAQACGFVNFDWVQLVTLQYDPSLFFARNVNKGYDPTVTGSVRLTSKRAPWSDPPQAGGYAQGAGGGSSPDNSYPFYYNPTGELASHENGTQEPACSLGTVAGITLSHHDAPADPCLPGGVAVGTAACQDSVLAPGATSEPAASYGGYVTHLAGVNSDGTATDLGIGFTWTSNYNGSTGGVSIKKTGSAADHNGTGGVVITSVNQTSNYQFPRSVGITAVNGVPTGSQPVTQKLLGGNQVLTTASGLAYSRVTQTFNGAVTLTNTSGAALAGPFQVLLNALTSGDTVANGAGSFGGYPYVTIAAGSLAAAQSASASVQFQNSTNALLSFAPLLYSGSFN